MTGDGVDSARSAKWSDPLGRFVLQLTLAVMCALSICLIEGYFDPSSDRSFTFLRCSVAGLLGTCVLVIAGGRINGAGFIAGLSSGSSLVRENPSIYPTAVPVVLASLVVGLTVRAITFVWANAYRLKSR